jgi:hypothetical protein
MRIFNYDSAGFYIGESVADESPLEPGVFLVPANATTLVPPTVNEGFRPCFYDGGWHAAAFTPITPVEEPVREFTVIYKHDIWSRCTDAEAVMLNNLLAQQTIRLQRLFNDSLTINTKDELFPMVLAACTAVLGAERANEILAPTE